MKARGHHIAEHHSAGRIQTAGEPGEIGVGLVDVEVFGEDAVLEVGELPPREHAAGVHGEAPLGLPAAPVGGDGRDDDPVPHLQIPHQGAHLHDLPYGLVAQDHVGALADGSLPHGVDIRGAGGDGDGPDNGVQGPAGGDLLLDPAGTADAQHGIALHFHKHVLLWRV